MASVVLVLVVLHGSCSAGGVVEVALASGHVAARWPGVSPSSPVASIPCWAEGGGGGLVLLHVPAVAVLGRGDPFEATVLVVGPVEVVGVVLPTGVELAHFGRVAA